MISTVQRRAYAEMFGPTVGDRCAWPTPQLVIESSKT
jgi:urease alpha subunit